MKKARTSSIFFATCIIILATAPLFAQEVKGAGNLEIPSSSGYLDPQSYYCVIGEVENVGNETVNYVLITVTYYNSTGNILAQRFDATMLNVILPGRKSPFLVPLYNETLSADVNSYNLSLTFSPADPKPSNLEITDSNSFLDNEEGLFHVIGNITNTGTESATGVNLVITYYNETDNVIAAKSQPVDPEIYNYIDPGQTLPFEFVLEDEDRTALVESYEIAAESMQYTVVPEYTLATLTLAILIISAATLLSKKKATS